MRFFQMPLAHRMRVAARRKQRYHTDEAYRLALVNAVRQRRGKEPLQSIDEIGRDLSRIARNRPRNNGRFA
jgi:hypothetical protein